MKFLIGLVVVVGLSMGAWQFYQYWEKFSDKPKNAQVGATAPAPPVEGNSLPGLPPSLQSVFDQAQQRGAPGYHDFLKMYGNTVSDPRKAWIELDYAVLLAPSNPAEARHVFEKVKTRVTSDSPVYTRVQELEKTYGE
jgi:hypothetical protein